MLNEFTVERANDFIKNNKPVDKYYPEFNFSAPIGWINDPNGVSIYEDELHLFYQYYPYDTIHGPMHWGHTKTADGVNWEHLDVSLAPDESYDKDGVFSGSAIEKDGKLYLLYTGHVYNEDGEIRENQSVAISSDGVHFEKYENNPVIDTKDVPEGSSIVDFRDPKVFEKDGKYYIVIGSKTTDEKGQVLLYESEDLLEWEFKSVILPYNKFLGDMVECPDLIMLDNKDAFLLSAMNYTDEETGEYYPHISWIIEGKVNWDTFVFEVESIRKMDGGFDYYAPQTTKLPNDDNEYLAIAWQQAWGRTLPTHDQRHGWSGQMAIPRILKEEDGKITQKPSQRVLDQIVLDKEIETLDLKDNYLFERSQFVEFSMKISDQLKLTLLNDDNEQIFIDFNGGNKSLKFSRKDTINIIDENNKLFDEITYDLLDDKSKEWNVKVFIDTSSIQVFINDYYTLTSTFYSKEVLDKLLLESDTKAKVNNFNIGHFQKEERK